MAGRKALLIANPGEPGAENYCEGVNKDLTNYQTFLTSPLGGFWYESEIQTLYKPDKSSIRRAIESLKSCTYAMVIFCGHGSYSPAHESTMLWINKTDYINSSELREGAYKQSIILDCCRKVETTFMFEEHRAAIAKAFKELNSHECRTYYDKRIEECESGLIVLHACGINETAGDDSSKGGYYSYNLIKSAEAWAQSNTVDLTKNYDIVSVVAAHNAAIPRIKSLSGNRQNPQIEKPRSEKYFPFAVMA